MAITTEPKGPKPPLAGLIKVQVNYQAVLASQTLKAANVLHVLQVPTATYTASQLATWLGSFKAAWETALKPYLAGNWSYSGYMATALDGSGLSAFVTSTTAGTGATPALPPQCAVVLSWKAPFSWRGGRPRTYLPGVPDTATPSVAGSLLSSAYTAPLATAATTLLATIESLALAGQSTELGFPSYYSRGSFRPTPIFYPFSSAVVHDRLDSQRKRSGKESTFPTD